MTLSHLAADVQKLSKQAIFAAHRGDSKHVTKLLADAEAVSGEILPILTELPTLRYGSFSNAMEEVRPKASSQSAFYPCMLLSCMVMIPGVSFRPSGPSID